MQDHTVTNDQGRARGTMKPSGAVETMVPGGVEGGRSQGRAYCSTRRGGVWTGELKVQDKSKQEGGTSVRGAIGLRGNSAGRTEGLCSVHWGFTNSSLGLYRTDILLRNNSLDQQRTSRYLRNDPFG